MSKTIATRHFLIYKTTNLINGKIYIGKHITKNIDDGYMGSGKHLKRAINKYGIENFKREILFFCKTEEDMNAKEAELVTEEFCLREDTYNICVGGKGGFSYINRNGLWDTPQRQEAASKSFAKARIRRRFLQENDPEWKKKVTENNKKRMKKIHESFPDGMFKGKKHRAQSIEKMRKSNRNSTLVEIDGVIYFSIKEAATQLNTYTSVLIKKLKDEKYTNYKYI